MNTCSWANAGASRRLALFRTQACFTIFKSIIKQIKTDTVYFLSLTLQKYFLVFSKITSQHFIREASQSSHLPFLVIFKSSHLITITNLCGWHTEYTSPVERIREYRGRYLIAAFNSLHVLIININVYFSQARPSL